LKNLFAKTIGYILDDSIVMIRFVSDN
jgi:hypothetical protein